jgi:adenosine deaminase
LKRGYTPIAAPIRSQAWCRLLDSSVEVEKMRMFTLVLRKQWTLLALALTVSAAGTNVLPQNSAATAKTALERKAELNLAEAKKNPLQLRHFLLGMPKGADLHYHLSGGVYAESFIRAAGEDGLCVDTVKLAFVKPVSEVDRSGDSGGAASVPGNQKLYDALVDSFSMRGFVPSAGWTAHDQFFATFDRFAGTKGIHKAEWVDEAATRAAGQNEQYLELMETPDFSIAARAAEQSSWTEDFAALRAKLFANGLRDNVKPAVDRFHEIEAQRREREHCGHAEAAAACAVTVKFIFQVLRGLPKEIVFAETLLAFETASADPENVVGLNFVMPEDGYVSMHDYALHMKMVKFLHGVYPKVHIALHAGELAYGMVPPDGLCCHIRLAVDAGAERIGHGVDIAYEDHPHQLMKEMAAKHVMVEINLTSNDVILGVSGKDHPLPVYRMFGVPVALSMDDEGVSRIDLTNEFVWAVQTYDLSYAELKKMARTGLEHAFLPGASLWAKPDAFAVVVGPCARETLRADKSTVRECTDFLRENERAQQQWELERRLRAFEMQL